MRIFISWSKEPSRTVAEALRDWLPDVIQSLEPWMSSADIGAGARWSTEVAQALSDASIGIICVTLENQREPWLLFEAGALAKTLENTFVCPYLIEMRPSDLISGPLTQFQSKVANKEGTFELLATVNRALGSDALPNDRLHRLFDRSWPYLEAKLNSLPRSPALVQRPVEEMISEVLETVRSLARRIPEPPPPSEAQLRRIRREFQIYKDLLRDFPHLSEEERNSLYTQTRELTNAELHDLRNYFLSLRYGAEPTPDVLCRMLGRAFLDVPAVGRPEAAPPTDTTQARNRIEET